MGSVRTFLLQVGALFGVNKDLPVTIIHVTWGERNWSLKKARYIGLIKTCLLQEGTL